MKKLPIAMIAIFALAATSANADSGLAIGASVGYVTVADTEANVEFDGNDVGYKLFGNYMFNNFFGIRAEIDWL